jgi:hypothetical protein
MNEKWEDVKTIIKETIQQLIEEDGSTETLKNRCTMRNAKLQ